MLKGGFYRGPGGDFNPSDDFSPEGPAGAFPLPLPAPPPSLSG
jgi:hypothetical protein